ncbi:MAG: TIGR04063 family PEP-CTERM/XrtA system glycosyltransferase [Gammaproteobacteria bacterium]
MRILHLLDHSLPLHSGYSFRTHNILSAQRARGWSTEQITSTKQDSDKNTPHTVDGITYQRSEERPSLKRKLPAVHQFAVADDLEHAGAQWVESFKPDVIQAHSSALNGLAGLRLAKRFKVPFVYELRAFWEDAAVDHGHTSEGSLRYRATRMLETYVVRNADAVTTICNGIRQDLIGRGIPPEKITVIPNAVNIDKFEISRGKDAAFAQSLGLGDAAVIGFIGSFYAYEGLDLLIKAFPAILRHHSNARLLLVGGGFQDGALRAQVAQLNLEDNVIFTGRVPHEEVNQYYDLIDVLAYPRHSMRLTELVTPLKPLESMAQGRLLVASDVGGHKELINHGVTGSLFKAGDAEDLARSVNELLGSPEQWPDRIAAGRKFVEEERNWTKSISNYAEVYERLTGRS